MRAKTATLALAGFGFACLAGWAGPADAQEMLVVDVPFAFSASGHMHNPGNYEFRIAENEQVVELQSSSRGTSLSPVLTRIAAATTPTQTADSRLVFDRVGDRYVLAEVWLPEQDGFLLYPAHEPHGTSVQIQHPARRTS